MYLPTENPNSDALPASISIALHKHASTIGATFARQAIASQTTSASAVSSSTSSNGDGSKAEKWYARSWVVPVGWALVFYCVLSMVLLCTLYGQGIVDGRLNYIPRHSRTPRASSAAATRHRTSSHWVNDSPDSDSNEAVVRHRSMRMEVAEEMRMHALREEALRAALVERILRQREREREREGVGGSLGGGESNEVERERDRMERRETQDLASRLESARVERALLSLGVL